MTYLLSIGISILFPIIGVVVHIIWASHRKTLKYNKLFALKILTCAFAGEVAGIGFMLIIAVFYPNEEILKIIYTSGKFYFGAIGLFLLAWAYTTIRSTVQ